MRDASRREVLPVSNTRDETRASYDRIARFYDLAEGFWERGARTAGIQALEVRPNERVVEVGFGTGEAAIALARLVGTAGSVEGVDLSPKMVSMARRRVDGANLDGVVSLETGDAVALPYADDRFDAAFMSFTLELLPADEIPVALAELRRVLRPGGRICIVAMSLAGKSTLLQRVYEWGHVRFPGLLDCRPIYVDQPLKEAGFEHIRSPRSTLWGLPIETATATVPQARPLGR